MHSIHCPMCIDFSKWLAIQYISCSVKFEQEMISQCINNLYHLIVKNISHIVTDGIHNTKCIKHLMRYHIQNWIVYRIVFSDLYHDQISVIPRNTYLE